MYLGVSHNDNWICAKEDLSCSSAVRLCTVCHKQSQTACSSQHTLNILCFRQA